MPASICDPVSSALRLSLAADDSQNSSILDSRLYSSAKSVLLSKIEFEESGDFQSNVLDGLKSKYVVIRPKKTILDNKVLRKETNCNIQSSEPKYVEDGLPKAKRTLFPVEKVQLGWQNAWTAGAGMQNVGNTCYLNSTLQALFHVPALANWLVSESLHSEKCNQQESCVICGMRATLLATQKNGGAPIKPWQVYSKLRIICRHLTPGRQEDAHEFLRYLVEAMEKCYLSRFINSDKLDQYSKETTPLNQILGGYLRSTVRCLACHHLSTTYQHFQDLLLDIRKHSTLDEALDSFFSRERLEDLGYKCEACNKKVSATKQFFVERAPMVLCIALKRFSLIGGKLSKHVQFRKKISLSKYMHSKNCHQQLSYKLVSLVTHLGPSQNCGHYTAIGQAPNSNYYQFDDSCVRPLPLSAVLGTNAYIMFFEKETVDESCSPMASTSSVVYGPQLPDNLFNREKSPLKLTYYRSDERKPVLSINSTEVTKPDLKPIILNGSLNERSESPDIDSEPWVVKQNGEVEKIIRSCKISNGIDKIQKVPDIERINAILRKTDVEDGKSTNLNGNSIQNPNNSSNNDNIVERSVITDKQIKLSKSPLEKLQEQMKKSDCSSDIDRNGSVCPKLVPYESDTSESERVAAVAAPSRRVWTVRRHAPPGPSVRGRANLSVKEREEKETSPNSSLSSMSGLSETAEAIGTSVASGGVLEAARVLAASSVRGYGAPVRSWAGTHCALSRQVFDERREERKRIAEASEEMDRGRTKKIKKFHNYYRFNNNRNGYNPFQDKQNKPHWGGSFKYRGDRRPNHHFNKHSHNKYKRFNRYSNNGHHYSRHH